MSSRRSRRRDDRPGQTAGQLLQRGVELRRGLCVDDAEHRLGPSQVDPAREEGAKRELTRLGMSGASGQAVRQDELDQRRRSRRCGSRPAAGPCRSSGRARAPVSRASAAGGRPPSASLSCTRRRVEGPGGSRSAENPASASAQASGPVRRTNPRNPGPGGLATATIVSLGSNMVDKSTPENPEKRIRRGKEPRNPAFLFSSPYSLLGVLCVLRGKFSFLAPSARPCPGLALAPVSILILVLAGAHVADRWVLGGLFLHLFPELGELAGRFGRSTVAVRTALTAARRVPLVVHILGRGYRVGDLGQQEPLADLPRGCS